MAKLRITYVKSTICCSKDQKATVRSLGLRKLNSVAVHDDTPSIRGMAFKVRHLVRLEAMDEATLAAIPAAKRTVRPTVLSGPTARVEPVASAPVAVASVEPIVSAPVAVPSVEPIVSAPVAVPSVEPSVSAPVAVPSVEHISAPAPVAAPAAVAPVAVASAAADDIEIIEGIGPKIAGVLKDAGITTFAQLADASVEHLSDILTEANLRRIAHPDTWPEQARLAAAGQWDALKTLQDALNAGRAVA